LMAVRHASRGLDGLGHIGYAAQRGLAPFGRDVFTRPQGRSVPRSRRYGGIPAWLRAVTPRTSRTLRASAGHPVLAVQGDTVRTAVRGRLVRATAIGPSVPASLPGAARSNAPATFTVTLTGAGRVVSTRAFTLVDETGAVHRHPRVTIARHGRTTT